MTHRCNSRQYVEAGLILHEHLPRSAANISAASLSAFLSAIAAKLHWPLWVHCPQQTHTTTASANIAQRHHVSTTHGEEMGGWEKALFKLIEVAALTHFLFRHFCCLWNDHPWCSSSSSELRLALGGFFCCFFQNVFSRHSHLPVPVREPEGRARDPGRATEPPALNQRDTRCVISHTNTHTQITSTRRGAGVRSLQRQFFFFPFFFFARKGNRGPKNCCSCGSTWFKAPLPLNRPVDR